MKNLVNDLNLASKLEYNMQPLCLEQVNMAAVARQCAADFMNTDISGKYPLEWKAQENLPSCVVRGDKTLLGRALNNLLNNAQTHNPRRMPYHDGIPGGRRCLLHCHRR